MKIYFRLVVRLMLATSIICSCSAVAQKQTFDIATYIPPKAWEKQASTNAIQFSKKIKQQVPIALLLCTNQFLENLVQKKILIWHGHHW